MDSRPGWLVVSLGRAIRSELFSAPFPTTRLDAKAVDGIAQPASRDRPRHLSAIVQTHESTCPVDGPNLCGGQTFVLIKIDRLAEPVAVESPLTF